MTSPVSQGLCETTLTERFKFDGCRCDVTAYPENLGPCKTFEEGASGRCVYCEHSLVCHKDLLKALVCD